MTESYSQPKMFIEAVLEVDKLVFKPQSELKKAKYDRIEIFEDGWQRIVLPNPPMSSSREVRQELETIIKEHTEATDEEKVAYQMCDEDSSYYIKEVLNENGIEFDEEQIEYIEDQCVPIIRHFKNHYNRPRPYTIAQALNIDFKKFETDTSKTPSYPSGHTVQPYVVANYLSKLHPELKADLRDAADICAYGRVIAGLHYPSDYKAGIILADQLMSFFKYDQLKEDAPVNSTGVAVSTDQPLPMKKAFYRRDNEKYTKALQKLLKRRYN